MTGGVPAVWAKRQNPPGNADDVGYTGHVQDVATGLAYMQARYYDPVIGRFLSPDPVGFSTARPEMFNRYSYANNSPLNFSDPNGEAGVVGTIAFAPEVIAACTGPQALACGIVAGGAILAVGGYYGAKYLAENVFSKSNDEQDDSDDSDEPGTPESDFGCVYECDGLSDGQETPTGKPYIGTADDKEKRAKSVKDGRDRENSSTVGRYRNGDRTGRQNAEQSAMNERGGKDQLDNKRDEVHRSKWRDRDIEPPQH